MQGGLAAVPALLVLASASLLLACESDQCPSRSVMCNSAHLVQALCVLAMCILSECAFVCSSGGVSREFACPATPCVTHICSPLAVSTKADSCKRRMLTKLLRLFAIQHAVVAIATVQLHPPGVARAVRQLPAGD